MEIVLYTYDGYAEQVNKTLSDGVTLTGYLRTPVNVLEPVITIRTDSTPAYNYAYIPDFNRYYFIKRWTLSNNNEYTLYISVDVLKTYSDDILNATGQITNTTDDNAEYSSRSNIPYDLRPVVKQVYFESNDYFKQDGSIIMIAIKG